MLMLFLGFSNSCPIGQACTLPTYDELAGGKADRELSYNITAEVTIDRESNIFRPNAVKNMLKNPPDSTSVRANGNCSGYKEFNSTQFSDLYIQNAVCPWKYECDFDPQRLPATLFYAKCTYPSVTVDRRHFACKEVYFPVNTIRTSSCDPLQNTTQNWEMERVKNVAVSCVAIAL